MTRSELVDRITVQNPHLFAKDVNAMVDVILDRITEALAAGDRVELRGFGGRSRSDGMKHASPATRDPAG